MRIPHFEDNASNSVGKETEFSMETASNQHIASVWSAAARCCAGVVGAITRSRVAWLAARIEVISAGAEMSTFPSRKS